MLYVVSIELYICGYLLWGSFLVLTTEYDSIGAFCEKYSFNFIQTGVA